MDIQNIFSGGLPEELKNLQDGQIYIFSSPEEGTTEKNIRICQYIGSLAKQNKIKNENKPAVFVIPTENAELWDNMFCLVENPNEKYLEISDIGSLTEMVYDFWGLYLCNMPKPQIAERYTAYHISIANYHPVRIPLPKNNKRTDTDDGTSADTTYDWATPSLAYLSDKTLSAKDVRKAILTALFEAEYNKDRFGVDYAVEELLKEFNSEKNKIYKLEIVPEKTKGKDDRIFVDCHIYITDENDNRTELFLKSHEKAVYLLFLLNKDGISIKDFPKERKKDEKYSTKYKMHLDIYSKIQRKLFNNNDIETPQLLQGDIRPIINKIKNKIADITPNKKYLDLFAIEGYKEKPFKIAAVTQEQRDIVIKAFGINQ